MSLSAARLLLSASLVLSTPALATAASAPASPDDAGPAAQPAAVLPGEDLAHPPPGSPEDQALWRSGLEVTASVLAERGRAGRLQAVLVSLRFSDRLALLAARGGEAGARGAEVARRLSDAYAVQYSVLTSRWPVETYRVCGYPAMEFGSMLNYGRADPADLSRHRAMLTGCVDQARASLALMKGADDQLQAAIEAADGALAGAGLGSPTAADASASKLEASAAR